MRGLVVVLYIVTVAITVAVAVPTWAESAGVSQGAYMEEELGVVTYVTADMRDKCSRCHPIGRVLAHRLDRSEWTTVVWLRMRPKMPGIFATYQEAEPLIDFLASRDDFLAQLE